MEYGTILLKTLIFYFILIVILRIMGKREVGELSVFDVVVFFLISELFSFSIDSNESIFKSILPILLLVLLQLITSLISLKNNKIRGVLDGHPAVLIVDGIINQKQLRKQRYTIDDLLSQLRDKGIDCLEKIKFAILETNGKLSVLLKDDTNLKFPFPLIKDGKIDYFYLDFISKDKDWLFVQLETFNINIKHVFLFLYYEDKLVVIPKEFDNKE